MFYADRFRGCRFLRVPCIVAWPEISMPTEIHASSWNNDPGQFREIFRPGAFPSKKTGNSIAADVQPIYESLPGDKNTSGDICALLINFRIHSRPGFFFDREPPVSPYGPAPRPSPVFPHPAGFPPLQRLLSTQHPSRCSPLRHRLATRLAAVPTNPPLPLRSWRIPHTRG